MSSQEICFKVLKPARVALLRPVLAEYHRKIRLDGSTQALTGTPEIAETIANWIQEERLDQPNSITAISSTEMSVNEIDPALVKAAAITEMEKPKTDIFTHVFWHIGAHDERNTLWVLRTCLVSLIPKGVAIVTITTRNPVEKIVGEALGVDGTESAPSVLEEGELMLLAEKAAFERARIRLLRREVSISGEELAALKKDLLKKLESQPEKKDDWRQVFEKGWERETQKTGSIVIESWLVVAMRWDLLCA